MKGLVNELRWFIDNLWGEVFAYIKAGIVNLLELICEWIIIAVKFIYTIGYIIELVIFTLLAPVAIYFTLLPGGQKTFVTWLYSLSNVLMKFLVLEVLYWLYLFASFFFKAVVPEMLYNTIQEAITGAGGGEAAITAGNFATTAVTGGLVFLVDIFLLLALAIIFYNLLTTLPSKISGILIPSSQDTGGGDSIGKQGADMAEKAAKAVGKGVTAGI